MMAEYDLQYSKRDENGLSEIDRIRLAAASERMQAREAARLALELAFPEVPKPFSDKSLVTATKWHRKIGESFVVIIDFMGRKRPILFLPGTPASELIRQLTG